MKPLVIYHADCTDGYGAAFAAWMKLGDGAEYCPFNYADSSPDYLAELTKGRDVSILDFSFKGLVMEHIFKSAKRVVWLDHHATSREYAEEKCGGYIGSRTERHTDTYDIVHDNEKSGALLAWEYFHPGTEVPLLIQHIDDRDRWQFKLEGSRELHAALSSYKPWSFEQWDSMNLQTRTYWEEVSAPLLSQGTAILRAQDQHVKSMAKQAVKCRIPNYNIDPRVVAKHAGKWELRHGQALAEMAELHALPGLAVNASLHQSEVGHELATTGGTFGLVWYMGADNRVKCSLRSNDNYDVSAIAKSFGGGGHRNAAGFETDITTLMGWLK